MASKAQFDFQQTKLALSNKLSKRDLQSKPKKIDSSLVGLVNAHLLLTQSTCDLSWKWGPSSECLEKVAMTCAAESQLQSIPPSLPTPTQSRLTSTEDDMDDEDDESAFGRRLKACPKAYHLALGRSPLFKGIESFCPSYQPTHDPSKCESIVQDLCRRPVDGERLCPGARYLAQTLFSGSSYLFNRTTLDP
jgi:hypothetical protein